MSANLRWTWKNLTVEQVFVVGFIIEISTVLLHAGIHSQGTGIDLPRAQIIVLELAFDISFLLTMRILDPHALNVGALEYVMPVMVRSSSMLLGGGKEARSVHFCREHVGDFIPSSTGVGSEGLQRVLEMMQRLRPGIGGFLRPFKDMLKR